MGKTKTADEILSEYSNRIQTYHIDLHRDGKPEAYARERKGRNGFYNPKGELMREHRKDLLKSIAKEQKEELKNIRESGNEYYLSMTLTYYVPLPTTGNKTTKILQSNNILRPISRTGDLDNLDKFYLDTCHDILYDDDKRVIQIHAEKYYSDKPRVDISADYIIIK